MTDKKDRLINELLSALLIARARASEDVLQARALFDTIEQDEEAELELFIGEKEALLSQIDSAIASATGAVVWGGDQLRSGLWQM